ncbi:unnamed protein product [Cylicostephanus goldi]|uniref:Uncharacterized protein n=1 Tax=Cylicostephanus goldi TaxID=71465 RepID=A0A3P6QSY4_CYLGO|nr:unnamed protein product [Cylicostephanus goldi]
MYSLDALVADGDYSVYDLQPDRRSVDVAINGVCNDTIEVQAVYTINGNECQNSNNLRAVKTRTGKTTAYSQLKNGAGLRKCLDHRSQKGVPECLSKRTWVPPSNGVK